MKNRLEVVGKQKIMRLHAKEPVRTRQDHDLETIAHELAVYNRLLSYFNTLGLIFYSEHLT